MLGQRRRDGSRPIMRAGSASQLTSEYSFSLPFFFLSVPAVDFPFPFGIAASASQQILRSSHSLDRASSLCGLLCGIEFEHGHNHGAAPSARDGAKWQGEDK